MIEKFVQRENTIFDILNALIAENIFFILVGGYAVSVYKYRFSVDADIVIKKEDLEKCEEILKRKKMVKTVMKDLDHVYAPLFMRYETKEQLPVSIDILIEGVGSRTTDASYSIEQLKKYSAKKMVVGSEKQVHALIPSREFLIVLKIHAGRLTDFRDIAALSKDLDISLIQSLLWRGKHDVIKQNLKKLFTLLDKKDFIDSFKGVFSQKKYDLDIQEVNKLKKLLEP